MLLMKKCYFDAIRGGRKTTTLRFWRSARVKSGSVHVVPGLGRVRVLGVDAVDEAGLREEDARADGFTSLRSLWEALGRLYPPSLRRGRRLYLVRFDFLGEAPAGAAEAPNAKHRTTSTKFQALNSKQIQNTKTAMTKTRRRSGDDRSSAPLGF
jgi:hypothetical protein